MEHPQDGWVEKNEAPLHTSLASVQQPPQAAGNRKVGLAEVDVIDTIGVRRRDEATALVHPVPTGRGTLIAVDTNVLVRFLVKDDDVQTRRVVGFMKRAEAQDEALYISEVVLCELVGALETIYGVGRSEIAANMAQLLRARQLAFRNTDLVARALTAYQAGRGDFADYLIREDARAAGADVVATFDKVLLKDKGFRLP